MNRSSKKIFKLSIAGSFLGIFAGFMISAIFPGDGGREIAGYMVLFADTCTRLFQMVVTPLVCFGCIGITYSRFSSDGNINTLYNLAKNNLMIAIVLAAAILLSSLHFEFLLKPAGEIGLAAVFDSYPTDLPSIVIMAVPKSVFESLSKNNIVQVLVFGFFFGLAAARLKEKSRSIIEAVFTGFFILLKMFNELLYLVTIVLFCISAAVVIRFT